MKLHLDDDHDVELELKCYPRVLHAVKATGVTMNIPCTNKGMKSILELIKNYIDESLSNLISITEFRYEIFEIYCKGNLSSQQAKDIFRSYPMSNGLPEGIEVATIVSTMEYKELIQFVFIEYEDIGRGRASSEASVEKKAA